MYKVKKITIDLETSVIDIEKEKTLPKPNDLVTTKDMNELSYEDFIKVATDCGTFSRKLKKTKKHYSLVVEYEVFDTANDNEPIKTKGTLKDAVRLAKTNPAYAVDMLIDLQNEDGESLRPDGDYLYSVQVYPTVKVYDNYETEIEI